MKLAKQFQANADEWHRETQHVLSIHELVQHPAFRRIVALGMQAVPLILEDLRDNPSMLFFALHEIVAESPVIPDKLYGRVHSIRQIWLQWGQEQGYLV